MGRDTERKERTLPARSGSSEEDDTTAAGSTTVVELGLPALSTEREEADGVSGRTGTGESSEASAPTGSADDPVVRPAESPPAEDETAPAPAVAGSRWAHALKTAVKAAVWMIAFPFLCILPFIIVLRIAVVAYQESTYDGWESLGIGMLAAILLVCTSIAAFMWTFGIRRRLFMPFLNICLTAMLCYCGYALFHLATSNAKTEEVRSYYTSLHPFLRVALKNLTFVDRELVITDVHRTKDEYRSMGLRPREYSLHFQQPTGFVHAVDLRTNGRPKVHNLLVELYFILMGFETIRHVGTADHLHVSLPLSEEDVLAASAASD